MHLRLGQLSQVASTNILVKLVSQISYQVYRISNLWQTGQDFIKLYDQVQQQQQYTFTDMAALLPAPQIRSAAAHCLALAPLLACLWKLHGGYQQ